MNWDYLQRNARTVVLLLLIVLVVVAVTYAHAVLLPFALALFLAYLLAPVIAYLSGKRIGRMRLPRGLSILVVYTVVLGLIALSGVILFPRFYVEVNRLVHTLPNVLQHLEESLAEPAERTVNTWLRELLPAPPPEVEYGEALDVPAPDLRPGAVSSEAANGSAVGGEAVEQPWHTLLHDYTYVVRRIDETRFEVTPQPRSREPAVGVHTPVQFTRQLSNAFTQLREEFEQNLVELVVLGRQAVQVLLNSVFTLFLVLMISGFLLVDPARIIAFGRSLVPTQHHPSFDGWLVGLDHGLSGVVRGQALICVVNGVLTGVGIAMLGVPFVVTLSVIAAVFSLIPIFGVLISTIPILIMALTVSFTTALLSLAWILVIHFIEGNFLNPKILGDSAKIHPVLIVFALLTGEHFAGVLGALLAVPIFSLVQNTFLFLKNQAESIDTAV